MLSYSSTNFPPWATLSSLGVITIAADAPTGTYPVNITLTNGFSSYTGSINLLVNPRAAIVPIATLTSNESVKLATRSNKRLTQTILHTPTAETTRCGIRVNYRIDQVYSVNEASVYKTSAGSIKVVKRLDQSYSEAGGYGGY